MMAGPWHQTFLTDLVDVQGLNECNDLCVQSPSPGGQVSEDRISARRLHKADRERLRRDKLNEQFSELAKALDPDRPKNDKATILGESIQVVKELHEEVKRLKMEYTSLLEESSDLTQEKNELQEEKASLKSETVGLQSQVQQCLCSSSPWMAMDPSLMMGATPMYPYPISIPQPVSLAPADSNQVGKAHTPLIGPSPCMAIPPPVGSFHTNPSVQPYAMFGNRMGDGSNPFFPFSGLSPAVTSHFHIERPYAQYPSAVQHPVPGYAVQVPPGQGFQSSPSLGSPLYKPCVPGIPVIPSENHTSSTLSKDSNDCAPTSQSSTQLVPGEEEQENGGSVTANDAGSPNRQKAKEAKDVDLELCGSKIAILHSSTCIAKEKRGICLVKTSLPSVISEGQAQDLAGVLEMEHDPSLRPPAA